MKTDDALSLQDIFFPESGSILEQLSEIEAEGNIPHLKQAFLEKARGIKWQDAFSEAGHKIGELLDIKITDILVRAWKQHAELQQYIQGEKDHPEESVLVPLSRHEVKSVHHPSLEIFIDDHLLGKMVFDLTVTFKLKGLILKIQDAGIQEIHTGECKGTGEFKFGDIVLMKKESETILLPGCISLGHGISL